MKMNEMIYLATDAEDATVMADAYRVNLEIDEYCDAENMNEGVREYWHAAVRKLLIGKQNRLIHAPYCDIYPAAHDPAMRELAMIRMNQAYRAAACHDISRMIVHSGYVPSVYDRDRFHFYSADFWRAFLADKPADFRLVIENQLEPSPKVLLRLMKTLDDPRVGFCLNIGRAFLEHEASLEEWIQLTAPVLQHVTLSDNDGLRDRRWPLGDGRLPLARVLDKLADAQPHLTYTINTLLSGPSLKWLETHGYLQPRMYGVAV